MKFHQLTRNLFLVVIIMVGLTSVSGATDLNIADLRQNDQTGTAVYLDQVVTTTGIVTVANEFGATGPVYIQNEGAGIALYGAGYVARLRPGCVVNVTSKVGFYSGLTELLWIDTVTVVNILDKTEIPEPTIVSISEILNQQWDGYEALEGSLIKLENVSFQMIGNFAGNTNYTITDNIGYSMDIRIDNDVDLVGSPIPTVPVTIVGVLSQFDSSSPFSEGYQLLPRSSSDITGGQGGGTTVLSYSFDKTTSDPLISTWATGSGQINLSDNTSIIKEGIAALQADWTINHRDDWGGKASIEYKKTAPVGEYLDVSGADYLTLWVYNMTSASQSGKTFFEFNLLEAGGEAAYDGTANSTEQWSYWKSGVFDLEPGWNQIRMPLIDRGTENPNDQGFSAPGWNGVANNGILDKDRIVGWQIIIGTENTAMGDIVSGTTLFDQLQLETGGGSNLTSQDVTVTFSVDMSSFNGEFAAVSLQGGTAPLDWFPGSILMIDPEQDGIYTVDVLFPAGSGKMVEYKFTALTKTGWFWENFAGNRSFEIDDSSPTQRLRLDSWISGGVTTAALSYSFDRTTSDPLISTWATGSGQINLSDNTSIIKEGIAALQVDWTINHGDDWGGKASIEYKKTAPVGEYLDVSGADYLTLWVYNMTSASQSGKTFFEFNLLEAGGEAAYDGTAYSTEQWLYWKSGVFDLEPGWNQIRMPLIDRGTENPNDQGFSAPGWNGVANNGILDKDRIVGWQISIQTENTAMGDIVTGTTLFDQLQLETGGGSNLTSQDVTVTFSVDMSSFNGEFAVVSLQGGTAPLDWFPGSTRMIDPEQDGIYTVDVLFPAGSGKMVEYKFTALTKTGWVWENFVGNRSFEIDDSSPIQRLRLDSWISGGVTTAALRYSFDKTTSDSLVSSWNSGSGNLHLADNFSTMKEGLAALEVGWQIVHEYEWGGNGTINYAKNAPVGEYLDVSGADYLTLWVYNMTSASQSGKTFFEFNLLEAGGEAAYDGTANSTEQWSYWKSGVFDLEPGWNQIRMPLIDRGTENPNDQGFSAPGWNGVANNGILDKDRIVGWQIIIQTNNTSMGDIVTGTTLFDQLQLETGGGSNLTSQDVTVTFSVDMSSFNGDFAAVSLQGGTAPLDWFPGSTRMIDPEQDGIYTVDVLFPAGSDKMVEYKFTALTDTGWVWENFVGNRSFEIDDSSPIQRLRLDSWISGGVTTAALSYSFDKTTSDPLISSWNSGSGNLHLADNFSTMKEGLAALEVGWQIFHEYEWGGNGTINYAKNAPVGEYLDVSGADYLTLWVYNAVPASQSERTLFEFHLLEAGGDAVYDGTCNSAEHWLYRISGVFDQGPGWNQIRMPLIDRGAEHPNDQGFSAPGWNGVANNGILDKDRIVGWQIIIQTNNTSMGDIVTGTTLFDQLKLETGGGGEIPVLSHFAPVYTGNPYLAMNIYVTDAKIDGVTLGVGDEIGIFDGDICVGAEVVTGTIAPYLPLVAATDDPTTTEKDGFTPGHTISYRLWDRDQSLEINSVQPTYTQGEGLFSSQGTAVVSLVGSYSISQTIGLDLGWNIVSFCAIPENPDMLNVFQNLVNNNSLIKIQNETGNAVEKLGAIGWVNNIGNLTATEGYYVKVASNQTMTIEGNGIPLPLGIPLTSGWNIMSYPASSAQNALDVIQPLIDDGKLQKVQDEVGNAIENLPTIGWVNNIGNFEPGKGYYIKVNSASAVTVNQPARSPLAKSQVATLAVPPSHYLPINETNPYLPMNVYVMSANVEGEPLKTGAEIAIYYQNRCITAAALPYPLNTENAYLPLIIGADDPLSEEIEGFNENDPISFKIWDGNEELLVSAKAVKYEDNAGLLKFNAHGTIVVELEAQRIPKEYSLHQNYPNPFNPTTTLRYELPKPGKVEIRIFDLQGRLVNQLVSEYQEVGKYSVVWNGCDNNGVPVPSGIYFYQISTGSFSKTRKAILMK